MAPMVDKPKAAKPKAPSRGGAAGTVFNCPDCQKPFSRLEYVNRHRRLKPSNEEDIVLSSAPAVAPSFTLANNNANIFDPSTSYASYSPIPSLSPSDGAASSSNSSNSPKTPFLAAPDFSPPASFPSIDPSLTLPADQLSLLQFQQQQKSFPQHQPFDQSQSTNLQSQNFTQDEILASEVLEDLLRSPTPYRNSPETETPWHGALAVPGASNENVMVLGGGGEFDSYAQEENGIEFTPEAAALADYFNKGGVGGISALELGFTHEPSMFPDHLFNLPEMGVVPDDNDSRFFLPSQKFCIGYLYPWHVPPLKTLSRYAQTASKSFLPSIPVIHPGTMVLSEMPTHTAFALTVAGGSYFPEGETFSNEMLVEKRVYLVRSFNKEGSTEEEKFAGLQSMLLYQRRLSHTFHGALVQMLKQLDLPTRIAQTQLMDPRTPGLSGEVLEAVWKQWVAIETRRRVAFIVFLADLETATKFDAAPLYPFSELCIDLPAHDKLWNAKSADEWLRLRLLDTTPRPVPFLDAIRALLSPEPPSPFSNDGILISELARLSSLPLLILTRTLSFLQMKTEEAIKVHDPFKTLLGGLGIFEGREKENRAVLERIKRGREILLALPGGKQRGGGQSWYEGIIPTAPKEGGQSTSSTQASDSTRPSPSGSSFSSTFSSTFSDLDDYVAPPPVQVTGAALDRQFEDAKQRVEQNWPDFAQGWMTDPTLAA
ncbi:zinc finger, C2H2-type transcription factor [Pseudohyphozyma bogoriensis]|nr:zinc finger, C2H2-type transcription factor [Pseudohyphozyma bogoriensis]